MSKEVKIDSVPELEIKNSNFETFEENEALDNVRSFEIPKEKLKKSHFESVEKKDEINIGGNASGVSVPNMEEQNIEFETSSEPVKSFLRSNFEPENLNTFTKLFDYDVSNKRVDKFTYSKNDMEIKSGGLINSLTGYSENIEIDSDDIVGMIEHANQLIEASFLELEQKYGSVYYVVNTVEFQELNRLSKFLEEFKNILDNGLGLVDIKDGLDQEMNKLSNLLKITGTLGTVLRGLGGVISTAGLVVGVVGLVGSGGISAVIGVYIGAIGLLVFLIAEIVLLLDNIYEGDYNAAVNCVNLGVKAEEISATDEGVINVLEGSVDNAGIHDAMVKLLKDQTALIGKNSSIMRNNAFNVSELGKSIVAELAKSDSAISGQITQGKQVDYSTTINTIEFEGFDNKNYYESENQRKAIDNIVEGNTEKFIESEEVMQYEEWIKGIEDLKVYSDYEATEKILDMLEENLGLFKVDVEVVKEVVTIVEKVLSGPLGLIGSLAFDVGEVKSALFETRTCLEETEKNVEEISCDIYEVNSNLRGLSSNAAIFVENYKNVLKVKIPHEIRRAVFGEEIDVIYSKYLEVLYTNEIISKSISNLKSGMSKYSSDALRSYKFYFDRLHGQSVQLEKIVEKVV